MPLGCRANCSVGTLIATVKPDTPDLLNPTKIGVPSACLVSNRPRDGLMAEVLKGGFRPTSARFLECATMTFDVSTKVAAQPSGNCWRCKSSSRCDGGRMMSRLYPTGRSGDTGMDTANAGPPAGPALNRSETAGW